MDRRQWIGLCAAALFLLGQPAAARGPADFPMDTPSRVMSVLFLDLAGLLGPRPSVPAPPLWHDWLSERTRAQLARLDALESADGHRTFARDWLCQCEERYKLRVPPTIMVERADAQRAVLSVKSVVVAGETHTVRVFFVKEEGWRIDDIADERGVRFTDAMQRGIAEHLRGRAPLP